MKSPFFHLMIWLLICAGALAAYGFWYSVITEKNGEVASLRDQIAAKTQSSVRATVARNTLADIQGEEKLMRRYFVAETEIVSLIDDLQSRAHAQSATMKVLSVSTKGTEKQGDLALVLSANIDGAFDALMRTVGAIEYAPYDVSISKFAMHKDAKLPWHADLELVVGSVVDAGVKAPTQSQ
jgi:hypothetical protein